MRESDIRKLRYRFRPLGKEPKYGPAETRALREDLVGLGRFFAGIVLTVLAQLIKRRFGRHLGFGRNGGLQIGDVLLDFHDVLCGVGNPLG